MTTRRSILLTAVVIVSALASGVAFSGSAAALSADTSAPYPHSPGTTIQEFPVSVVAESSDAITRGGMQSMTLDFGASDGFDGNLRNVDSSTVSVAIAGQGDFRRIGSFDLSKRQGGRLTLTFGQSVPVSAGDRIVVDVGNATTPSSDGDYVVDVSATTPSGTTDGPASVSYRVIGAQLDFPNQTASQFGGPQSVTVSGVVPNAGYVGVFETTENGSRGELVGSTGPITAKYNPRNYTVNLNGNVEESQPLMAVAYYETAGDTQSDRLNGTFDPNEDGVVSNNGVPTNATGYVSTLDADGRVAAGSEYDQGARLYFSQGEPNTGYQIQTLQNGTPGQTVVQFESAANGSAVIDTGQFEQGQYVITRVADGSVVALDNDSTTSPQDDSFYVTGQSFTEQSTTNGGSGGSAGTTAAATDAGSGGAGSAGGNGSSGSGANGSGGGSGDGEDDDGSGVFGPGFGVTVAVIAVLGAALLAARRDR